MFLGSELEHGNILEEQWRRAKLIVQMCDPLRESQLSASAKSTEFRKVEESVLHVCSSLRDSLGGGRVGGVGRGKDRVLQVARCSQFLAAVCSPAGANVFFCLLPWTVLQHPGEQHCQSVRPSDHGQVSLGSALAPPALC